MFQMGTDSGGQNVHPLARLASFVDAIYLYPTLMHIQMTVCAHILSQDLLYPSTEHIYIHCTVL